MKFIMGLGLVSALLLSGCQSSSQKVSETHNYSLKLKCPTLLDMKVGDQLVFHAEENPSTGYQWHINISDTLFKVEQSYIQEESDQPVVGAPGEKQIKFIALEPGQSLIELQYSRAWEKDQPEEKWFCRVRVS